MPELTVCVDKENPDKSDLDLLEQIYRKVKLYEYVKFRGKAYRRVTSKNNRNFKYPYHFLCTTENIYDGSTLMVDADGEEVNTLCHYKAVEV